MNFLYTMIILSSAVGIGGMMSHSALRDAVRSALGVLLISAMVSPFVGAISAALDFSDMSFGGVFDGGGSFESVTELAFEEGVASAVSSAFSGADGVRVTVRGFSPGELRCEWVTVILPSDAVGVDFRAVRDFVEENFTRVGGCEVVYG
jgi:hypothetical protein